MERQIKTAAAVAALVATLGFGHAAAASTVLDFNDLKTPGSGGLTSYTAQGYSVTSNVANGLYVYSTGHPYNADKTGATLTGLANSFSGLVTRADGKLFDFLSLDLSDYMNSSRSIEVLFSFTDANGATTSQSVFTDKVAGLQHFDFGRTGLKSFTVTAATGSYVQFDNMALDLTATAAVPEPATWALMILGFGGVGGVLRRRRTVAFA